MTHPKSSIDEVFEQRLNYPDIGARERFQRLVGIDDQKDRLTKIISLLVNPFGFEEWMKKHHPGATAIVNTVLKRPPLVVLAGDVGAGKTELAETVGDAVARQEGIEVSLFPLSLSARGQGRVGEMTQLLATAFEYAYMEGVKLRSANGKARGGVILLVDEADALAQSREAAQMHHEDRAGVNAFIRGIDRISNSTLPIAVIMCTNRLGALDPAVKRRAADILQFGRPNDLQRRIVLSNAFDGFSFTTKDIDALVTATGENNGQRHSFAFSDLTQRLLPAIVLDAYPSKSVNPARAIEIAKNMVPTPPFQESSI